jgi:metal-responsive CopG/Arc/MetJ family transcriptional regulator
MSYLTSVAASAGSDEMRTTLALPDAVLERVDRAVREGKAPSRNEFVADALRRALDALERAAIDAAFAEMADDPEAREEARRITEEFARADREALEAAER